MGYEHRRRAQQAQEREIRWGAVIATVGAAVIASGLALLVLLLLLYGPRV